MRICPHCDSEIPENQRTCPSCGAKYWNFNDISQDADRGEEEENEGCLSIFALHFLVALAVFAALLFAGFVIHLLVHFEKNQVKVIWTGAALLAAAAISALIAKMRRSKEKGNKDQR